jgi:benzoylformate decarboxylase
MASPLTVREAVLAFLRDQGMRHIFGNPGSTELPLFRGFPDDFHYVLGLQESVVIGLADGYAQATGGPAFINLHSAAGTGHAMGAIFTAFKNRTPLIVTAGQQARSLLLHDPFLYSHRPTELVQPYVKYAVEPARAADVPQAIARAWFQAMTYPRGPVFVSIPADDWDQPCEPVPHRIAPAMPGAGGVDTLRQAFAAAQRPVIVVGGEVDRDGAWEAVVDLAERTGAPVWHSPLEGRVGFPQNHASFQGVLPADPAGVVRTLGAHDLILAIGTRAFTFHVEGPRPYAPPEARLILLGTDPEHGAAAPSGEAIIAGITPTIAAGPCPAHGQGAARFARRRRQDHYRGAGCRRRPRAQAGQPGGRGSAHRARPDRAAFADRHAAHLLHLRQWRARFRAARCSRRGDGAAGRAHGRADRRRIGDVHGAGALFRRA